MKPWLQTYWFLLSLLVCLVVGSWFWESLEPLRRQTWLRYAIIAAVMFLMAWPLELRQIRASLRRPQAAVLASVINLGLAPLLAWPLSWLLAPELAAGLIIAAATPCTLASAAVWTRRGGGDEIATMMTTVITNALCFLVTPMWIALLVIPVEADTTARAAVNGLALVWMLFVLVLLPMVLAQLTRVWRPLAQGVTRRRVWLSTAAQIGILLMVLLGAIQTGEQLAAGEGAGFYLGIAMLVGIATVLHLAILYTGIAVARWWKRPPAEQIAVGIAGSQKTLMVGLTASIELGVSSLPIIVYHTIQLVVDTWIVDRFRRRHFPQRSEKSTENRVPLD